MIATYKEQWFGNIKGDILAGIVVALALIPESIAFSIIAGVDPMVGLYASFCMAVTLAFVGGRPALISAATGAMALLMVPLVKEYGLQYLLAATILTGVIQFIFGVLKIGRLMRFIPRAVMIGFVNALAILILMAQLPHFIGVTFMTYVFVAITIAILYILPRYIKTIPAPLIAIVVLTTVAIFMNPDLRTVGDLGSISSTLPQFLFPDVPLNLETLKIILPYSFSLAIVGLLESLLTSSILDDMTETKSNKNMEARGQGIANVVTGLFGGMGGCAMIGQSVINVKSGGRGRLSIFIAGAFLMFLIIVLGDVVVQIPMPVLVGIMIVVCIGTFDWHTFYFLVKAPRSDAIVMVVTVAMIVATNNLSIGVIGGVVLSAIFFVTKISKITVSRKVSGEQILFDVKGQLFFASVEHFVKAIEVTEQERNVIIDFTESHIWDDSGADAVEKTVSKLRENGYKVTLTGLDAGSHRLVEKII